MFHNYVNSNWHHPWLISYEFVTLIAIEKTESYYPLKNFISPLLKIAFQEYKHSQEELNKHKIVESSILQGYTKIELNMKLLP